jgi:hypothetical protein
MGSGLGSVQRAIVDIFDNEPSPRLTVAQVVARVYPGEPVTRVRTNNVGRALRQLAPTIGLRCCRIPAPDRLGWKHIWGKTK